ncbi:MAG: glucose-6-phosphate isomerase [Bacteroidales bacterium]|nr:glucose-6-phosphate isomerase [Bacteroidales bacterium]
MIQTNTDLKHIRSFVTDEQLREYENKIESTFKTIYDKSGAGNDFLGWVTLPSEMTKEFIQDIKNQAELLRKKSEVFVVVGIGGSYLGARAVIESLTHQFASLMNKANETQIVYAGHNMSEDYLVELLELLDKKDYSMAVISKSGTTTEPAVAFRILKNHLENKYGKEEAKSRIVAITDKERGALKTLANTEGYKTYIVPDNVGGRYSVLTPVGLLPIAVAGIDIEELVNGALAMEKYCKENSNSNNVVAQYAVARQALYHDGKTNEILVSYEPRLHYIAEWWKQLYGESEGKEGKGIFPASDTFTTDLHSMGQYIQEGLRNLFETIISVEKPSREIRIPLADNDLDQLNYIAGKRLSEVNSTAETATILAHVDGGVPNIIIQIPEISASTIGELIYFFEMGCALSGYMLEVNPFDQPGVEAYKKNMFALLGKKGFEERAASLRERIK